MITAEVSRWILSCSMPIKSTHMSECQLYILLQLEPSIVASTVSFTRALNSLASDRGQS